MLCYNNDATIYQQMERPLSLPNINSVKVYSPRGLVGETATGILRPNLLTLTVLPEESQGLSYLLPNNVYRLTFHYPEKGSPWPRFQVMGRLVSRKGFQFAFSGEPQFTGLTHGQEVQELIIQRPRL